MNLGSSVPAPTKAFSTYNIALGTGGIFTFFLNATLPSESTHTGEELCCEPTDRPAERQKTAAPKLHVLLPMRQLPVEKRHTQSHSKSERVDKGKTGEKQTTLAENKALSVK